MTNITPQLISRAQSAPLFLLSFRYRDELAAMASELGWRVIAARRSVGVVERFIASGAIIAVVDLRGAGEEGIASVAALSEAVEANGAALLVISARGSTKPLAAALTAGATHVLTGNFGATNFMLALRSAERHALRMLVSGDPQRQRPDVWRDAYLGWEEHAEFVTLSPALTARLKADRSALTLDKFLALLPKAAQTLINEAIVQIRADGLPRAITHKLSALDAANVAHHLRRDPVTLGLQGLVELPIDAPAAVVTPFKDGLTGLNTLAAARQRVSQQRAEPKLVLMISLTRFEMINAAFGRPTGDAVLRTLSKRIERAVDNLSSDEPFVARVAGTTFLVSLADHLTSAKRIVGTLIADIERPVIADGHEVSVGCCVGGVMTEPGEAPTDLIRRASAALAQARLKGESASYILDEKVDEAFGTSAELETGLRNALDRNEIDVLFQPQVSISSGEIVGVEALARWQHPVHGMLGAGTLFAVAERSDYLNALSAHIQKRAAAAAAAWPPALAHLRVAINVTAQDIARAGFAASFLKLLEDAGFPRKRLTVEITESGLIGDLSAAANLLAELRSGGCRVAIDDFGTGYSSLAYLKALPLDYLKIDKALAQDITGNVRDRVVVRGVIDMARSLGLSVIAEGVETEAQLAALAEQGCNYYQGFLCSEAIDSAALEKLVTAR